MTDEEKTLQEELKEKLGLTWISESNFNNGFEAVEKEGEGFYFINKAGEDVFAERYVKAANFMSSFAAVKKEDGWFFINIEGKDVFPEQRFEAVFGFSGDFAGVEKELVLCECCGSVVGPKSQLLWLIKKLGPLTSGNFNLIYTAQKELSLADNIQSEIKEGEVQRPDIYSILCPKCRHLVLVFNQSGKNP